MKKEDATKNKSLTVTPKDQAEKALAIIPDKDMADRVLSRVSALEKGGGINFPANYSYANALKSAWLIIQTTKDKNGKPALSVCTKESVANALLDMVIQALSPMKKQCYFIVRGNQLCMDRSYHGTVAVTKRLSTVKDAFAREIFEGDVFEYHVDPKTLDVVIDKHEQKLENINPDKIVGAYGVVVREDGSLYIGIMNADQIHRAWNQGAMKGGSGAHKNFGEEMSKKSVLNRTCKAFINTSDDSDLLIGAINRTTENDYVNDAAFEEDVNKEIEENANKVELDIQEPEPEAQLVDESTGELFNGNTKAAGPKF